MLIGQSLFGRIRKIGEKFSPTKIAEKVNRTITGTQQAPGQQLNQEEDELKQMNEQSYKKPEERQDHINNYSLDRSSSNDEYAVYVNHKEKKVRHIHRGTASLGDVIDDVSVLVGNDRSTGKMKRHEKYYAATKSKYEGYSGTHSGHSLGGLVSRRLAKDNNETSINFNEAVGFSSEDLKNAKKCKMFGNRPAYCTKHTNIRTSGDVVSAMAGGYGRTKVFKGKGGILKQHKLNNF